MSLTDRNHLSQGTYASGMGWNLDNSYARLPASFLTSQHPVAVRSPKFVIFNEALADDLGLDADAMQSQEGLSILAGNLIPEGAFPIAQAYAGHQFGHFTMLGDGRALLLGEQITPRGERFDIQLKGSGQTPYSRGGDGRAALGPMLREYIISEAMHSLGIPTTRSLAVVTTGEPVFRETSLPGAILTRVAASHLRVGTFQYLARWGTVEELRVLADYTIQRHFPEIDPAVNPYLSLLQSVIKRQAGLVVQWQLVGFIHGVMNTDNMAISGETIDYGPCAFMDHYDPATVFSSIDRQGRYAYGNQPSIAGWNLARFAETLLPLLHDEPAQAIAYAQAELDTYFALYHEQWLKGMRAKMGLMDQEPEDESLIADLLSLMQAHQADFTNTFRALTFYQAEDEVGPEADVQPSAGIRADHSIRTAESVRSDDRILLDTADFKLWLEKWQARRNRMRQSSFESHQLMKKSNPALIPRNHLVEAALEAAVKHNDYSEMKKLLAALANPFAHTPEQDEFAVLPEPSNHPYRTFCGT